MALTRRRSWRGRRMRGRGVGGRGHGGQTALLLGQRDWKRGFYSALPRHGSGCGTIAPRSVARQSPAMSPVAIPVVTTSACCRATMHDATQTFDRASAIGAAKSISFLKNRQC